MTILDAMVTDAIVPESDIRADGTRRSRPSPPSPHRLLSTRMPPPGSPRTPLVDEPPPLDWQTEEQVPPGTL